MFGFLRRRSQPPSSPELGTLGTHAFVVTEWQPGPTSWRPVNRADARGEPLRKTYSTRGALVLNSDTNLPVFQGEKTPVPASGGIAAANDYLDAYALSQREGGYPS